MIQTISGRMPVHLPAGGSMHVGTRNGVKIATIFRSDGKVADRFELSKSTPEIQMHSTPIQQTFADLFRARRIA